MSKFRIEEIAEQVLLHAQVRTAPVDIWAVLKMRGLKCLKGDLGETVRGFVATRGTKQVLAVHKKLGKEQQRFMAAHQLGHICLGHVLSDGEHAEVDHGVLLGFDGSLGGRMRLHAGKHRGDADANRFASALLLPGKMLRASVAAQVAARPVLMQSMSSESLLDETELAELAREYVVSLPVLVLRLVSLRLLSAD